MVNLLLAALLATAPGQPDAPVGQAATAQQSPPTAWAPIVKPQPREVYQLHLAIDVPVTLVAASAGLVRELFKDELVRKTCPCDPSGINSLDRGAVGNHSAVAGLVSDITAVGVPLMLPLFDLLDLEMSRAMWEDLVVYAETIAIDTALQNATNFIVARPRPRTYAGDPAYVAGAEGYLSFYAGHVSTIFASVSAASFTIRRRYGEHIWPWIVSGLIATSVAVERVASGDHFPTDVAAGALAGTAVGLAVPWLHLRRGESGLQVVPVATNGLALVGAF
jgi:membrane-associated phospholipid phosphatase